METNSPADDQASENPPSEPQSLADGSNLERVSGAQEELELGMEAGEAGAISEDEPGESGSEPAQEGAAGEGNELMDLARASQKARLAPADEERMTVLLTEALLGGRSGVARAVEALPLAPWIVSVRSVEAVWKDLTAGFRTQLLAGLGKDETDAGRRLRLSLARALYKLEPQVALKLAVTAAREMKDKDSGVMTPKNAQIFANVFIGRAKPWIAQLPLAELKPAEADAIAHCAMLAVFTVPHPPVAQLGILKWANENGRLEKLQETVLEAIKKGVGRWSGKWQATLRREVNGLPEEILSVLKPATPERLPDRVDAPADESNPNSGDVSEAPESEEETRGERDEEDEDEELERAERPRKERPVDQPRPQRDAEQGAHEREREEPRERPVYTPRNAGAGSAQKFNLHEALRQIEAHVQALRNDLAAAQAKTRHRDDERRRPEKTGAIIQGELSTEELARLNLQLEARNQELQSRITEMAQHSEDVAASMGVMADEPVSDTGTQLRTLLALKLQEDFADFNALEKESNDLVVQQHYKGLLRHVFEVLTQLQVPLK